MPCSGIWRKKKLQLRVEIKKKDFATRLRAKSFFISFRVRCPYGLSVGCVNATLSDTSLLASKVAEVVELSAAYLTVLVHLDAVDVRRLDREDTLYTYCTLHLTNGETLLVSVTRDLDNYTTVELNTLLCTLDNFVSDCDCVT